MSDEFETLSAARKERLIRAGINFMREIFTAYGDAKGTQIWEDITQNLDPDFKGRILLSMLTSEYEGTVLIKPGKFTGNRVSFIKILRNYSKDSYGLKEAKDLVDSLIPIHDYHLNVTPVDELIIEVKLGTRRDCMTELAALGLEVL